MNKPEVSVIIPTLNEERYILNTLKGLQRQTFKNFEVLVSDGGSKDRTVAIARRYAKVVIKKGAGVSKSRNIAAKSAKGKLLIFIDGDTKPSRRLVETYHNAVKGKVIAATGPIYPLEKTKRRVRYAYKFVTVDLIKLSIKAGFPSLVGSNFAVSKKVFDKVGGFNEKFVTSEDWDLAQRVKHYGKIVYLKDALVHTSARSVFAWGLKNYTLYTVDNIMRYYLLKKPNSDYEKVR